MDNIISVTIVFYITSYSISNIIKYYFISQKQKYVNKIQVGMRGIISCNKKQLLIPSLTYHLNHMPKSTMSAPD